MRHPAAQPVTYAVSAIETKNGTWLSRRGELVDVSETGVCMRTDHPLSPGHVVWLDGTPGTMVGIVRWCRQLDTLYRIGIELEKTYVKILDDATTRFNETLLEIEKRCQNPHEAPDDLYKATSKAVDDVLAACKIFENGVRDKAMIHDARVRFREKTNPILSKSVLVTHTRTWPQGYQGDYKMLENLYRNTPLSEGIGYYLDLCCLNAQLAIAVRNRLKLLESILRNEFRRRQRPSVMNIACGSCREVFELAEDIKRSDATVTCIDLDNNALAFAADRLLFSSMSLLSSEQVILRRYNALRMFDHELNLAEFGMQDIIYSVGFFDYLNSDFLSNLFGSLYDLLNPGGRLIASFKDADRYRHQDYHWIGDWDGFLQRTVKDFRDIFRYAGIPESSISELREESGMIVFYLVDK